MSLADDARRIEARRLAQEQAQDAARQREAGYAQALRSLISQNAAEFVRLSREAGRSPTSRFKGDGLFKKPCWHIQVGYAREDVPGYGTSTHDVFVCVFKDGSWWFSDGGKRPVGVNYYVPRAPMSVTREPDPDLVRESFAEALARKRLG